mgnify:CR=1 FL=1
MTANVPAEAKPETTERQTPEQIASENEVARTTVTELDQAATEPAPALTPPPVAAAAPVEDKKPAEVVRAKSAREEQLERIEANRKTVIENESGMIAPADRSTMLGQTLRPDETPAAEAAVQYSHGVTYSPFINDQFRKAFWAGMEYGRANPIK